MRDFVFVDGPLAGQTTSLDDQAPGEVILVEVVDFNEDPLTLPRFEYLIESNASQERPGELRFAQAHPLLECGSSGD